MKFKIILELLLVFTLIAFASSRIINNKGTTKLARRNVTTILGSSSSGPAAIRQEVDDDYDENDIIVSDDIPNDDISDTTENSLSNEVSDTVSSIEADIVTELPVNTDDANPINRYCKCTQYECNCCRDFSLPLVPIKGPGCATIQYLSGDRMSVGIKFGDRLITQRVISGRRAKPVCVPLPGGYNRFCGRIYGISKREEDFKACLGLELRADNEVEAVLRVSCFEFGPRGLAVSDAEPLPAPVDDVEEDDDDDDDILGGVFGDEDDDDDDDEDDDDDDDDDTESDDADADDEGETGTGAADYTGFSLLDGDVLEELLGTDTDKKKVKKPAAIANRNAPAVISTGNSTSDETKIGNETPVAQNNKEESSEDLLDVVEALVSDDDDEEDDDEEDDDDNETEESDDENAIDEKEDELEKLEEQKDEKDDAKEDQEDGANKKDEQYDEQNLVADDIDDDDSIEDEVEGLVGETEDDDDDDDDDEDNNNELTNEVDSASNLSKQKPSFLNKLSNISRFFKMFSNNNNNVVSKQ